MPAIGQGGEAGRQALSVGAAQRHARGIGGLVGAWLAARLHQGGQRRGRQPACPGPVAAQVEHDGGQPAADVPQLADPLGL